MVNKRDVLDVLKDGKTRNIFQIVEELGLVDHEIPALRTIMGRCYNDGYVCEVLPREGRKKLWKNSKSAFDLINHDFPEAKDGVHVTYFSIEKPDMYRFHEDCIWLK